jgi:hypothetical protein
MITDVALDQYSSDGHDGVLIEGRIDNDETLPLLAGMAVAQARAGADIVAPSDMMDGRVAAITGCLVAGNNLGRATAGGRMPGCRKAGAGTCTAAVGSGADSLRQTLMRGAARGVVR